MAQDESGRPKRVLRKSQPMPENPPASSDTAIDTKKKVQRVVRSKPAAEASFVCLECGTAFPRTSERCPKCNTRYVQDSPGSVVAEPEMGASGNVDPHISSDLPWIHFDSQTGSIEHLDGSPGVTEVGIECANCGALVDFDIDRCPICGSEFEDADKGMVSLFDDMEFDRVREGEMDCPLCGEKVVLEDGRCPSCEEMVCEDDPIASDARVDPMVRNENVVFVHLDVEHGEMNCLRRLARRLKFEPLTIKIETIGRASSRIEAAQRV